MYGQDSRGGRPRGQSSFGNDWRGNDNDSSYGRNQFHDSPDDYQNQGFRRYQDPKDSGTSDVVCQNYLQNKCMRGNNCPFLHPPASGGNSRPAGFSAKRQQNPWLNFCIEYLKGNCPYSDDCRLLHVSQRDEDQYASTGDIPASVVEQAMSKSMVMDWAYIGKHPHCKDYLQGSCNMRGCNYRHLNTDQYVVEVLAALREKFMIPHDEMFQESSQGNSFIGNRSDVGQYGKQQGEENEYRFGNGQSNRMNQERGDSFGMRRGDDAFGMRQGPSKNPYDNDYEPDSKRARGMDYNKDGNMRSRFDDNPNFPQGVNAMPQSLGMRNSDPLDDLRQQNIKMTETNQKVKKTAQMLEVQNEELRKALRLALDLNSHARNLQEFRGHLREIQATLRKRGFAVDDNSGAGNWNDPSVGQPQYREDNRMGGDRFQSRMDYERNFDRHSQRPNSGNFNSSW